VTATTTSGTDPHSGQDCVDWSSIGAEETVDEVWAHWQDAVNMTANELENFLGTDESKSASDKGSGGESRGRHTQSPG
jgi:hypothetical protein